MAGPAPKSPEERRRRNIPAAGEWVTLPAEPYDGPRPKLPSRLGGNRPRKATLDTWRRWWSSPMAWLWDEGDWPGLIRLLVVVDEFHRSGKLALVTEIRLQEDRFGLSPKGRQALRWRLPGAEDDLREEQTREPRRRFRVV